MKIFLVGGGTGGPTAPLLAVGAALKKIRPKTELFFVGTGSRIEARLLAPYGKNYHILSVPAGKWRRYFSLRNFGDLFKIALGFLKSLYYLRKFRPDLVFGAGSFAQVPAAYAAFLMRIPVVLHQQDIEILLSTKLAAPVAAAITASFEANLKDFSQSSGLFWENQKSKISWTGNPVRREILKGNIQDARKIFKLSPEYPTVLFMGGGSGAKSLNLLLEQALPELVKYVQVIHLTGGKSRIETSEFYHPYDFLDGTRLAHAYAAADLVVSRGGLSSIAELSALAKPAILIPLQGPQEVNVRFLNFLEAAVGISEHVLTPKLLVKLVRKVLWEKDIADTLRKNIKILMPSNADERIAKLLIKVASGRK